MYKWTITVPAIGTLEYVVEAEDLDEAIRKFEADEDVTMADCTIENNYSGQPGDGEMQVMDPDGKDIDMFNYTRPEKQKTKN